MPLGFARYLYLPEDGTSYSLPVVAEIQAALCAAGLAEGPGGEGLEWTPFRPAGALARFTEQLGLVYSTLDIETYDEPRAFRDNYLGPRAKLIRCPRCGKPLPEDGVVVAPVGEALHDLVEVDACQSCGCSVDDGVWLGARDSVVFCSRLVIGLSADRYANSTPSLRDDCPAFVACIEAVLGRRLREVFIAW